MPEYMIPKIKDDDTVTISARIPKEYRDLLGCLGRGNVSLAINSVLTANMESIQAHVSKFKLKNSRPSRKAREVIK